MAELYLARYAEREQTIYLPNGEKAKLTIIPTGDDSHVRHIEHGDVLDAVVRPATITNKVEPPTGKVISQEDFWRQMREFWKAERVRHVRT